MSNRKPLLAAAMLACTLGTADASNATLEDAFWACDYVATTHGTAAAPGDACTAVYEEFKATRFDGSFEELVAWWQVNKPDAHARMAQLIATAPVAPAASPPVPESAPAKPSRAARFMAATRAYVAELAATLRGD